MRHEELLSRALFTGIVVWILAIAAQLGQLDVQAETVASTSERSVPAVS
jgi:hypothetical protein